VQELIQFQLATQGMVLVVQTLRKLLSLLRRMVAEILETVEVLVVLEVLAVLEVMRTELVHQSQSSVRLLPYPLSS
jgi:hypothetical protein